MGGEKKDLFVESVVKILISNEEKKIGFINFTDCSRDSLFSSLLIFIEFFFVGDVF